MGYVDIAYLTAGVIKNQQLADLGDHTNKPGDITDATTIANINAAIERASDRVDTYLRSVYDGTLPLTVVPDEVKAAAAALTINALWASKNRLNEVWADREAKAISWLKDVAAGRAVLSLESDSRVTSRRAARGTSVADREFTSDEWGSRF